ncbi:MAG TPA: hypothetical protein VEH27_15275 [Methylomirabilota bacterium]|nr:hypothetical protein [Methylomirabilota bacterium]
MDFLLYWTVRIIIGGISMLPLDLVARIGRALGAIAYTLDARHRKVALNNLTAAFQGERTEAEIRALARENFKRLGENYCCAIKTAFMSEAAVAERLETVGVEPLAPYAARGQNLVVAIGHFGNFELYARANFKVGEYTFATTYRALRQPALTRLMQELRSKSHCVFFERRTDADALKTAMNKGRVMIGLLSDQHAGRSGVWVPFFGRSCSTSTAPAVLALRYDARLFSAICYRTKLAHWRIEVGPEIALHTADGEPRKTADVMSEVNAHLEAAVRRDPANWFWVHKRWKPPEKRQLLSVAADERV